MPHIIKRQVIDLLLNEPGDHFNIQQKISGHYFRYFIPILEKVFDGISGGEDVIIIDRLEIDLGFIGRSQVLKTNLDDEILKLFSKKINEYIREFSFSPKLKPLIIKTKEENIFSQWLFYMRTGYLPWNSLVFHNDRYRIVLEILATDFNSAAELSSEIRKDEPSLARIIKQHPESFLVSLAEILTTENQGTLPQVLAEIKAFLKHLESHSKEKTELIPDTGTIEEHLWKHVFLLSASPQKKQTTLQIAANILKKHFTADISVIPIKAYTLPSEIKLLLPVLEQFHAERQQIKDVKPGKNTGERISKQEPGIKQSSADKLIQETDKQEEKGTEPAGKKQDPEDTAGFKESKSTTETFIQYKNAQGKIDTTEEQPGSARQNIREDGIFVQNAGLVLIHPFIHSYFKHIGLVTGKKFVSLTAQEKALYLLHYTASGSAEAEEYELVVPKILCGFDIEKPVSKKIPISEKELKEANNMLKAVIEKWNILNNTSPNGLREGFLRRNGKIQAKNNDIYIFVEKNAIDILIDHLPWSMSIIKLPWLDYLLRAEWR